jgi:hypothetical protein
MPRSRAVVDELRHGRPDLAPHPPLRPVIGAVTPLSVLYDRVVAASARGEARAAHAAFLAIVGLHARGAADRVPTALPRRSVAWRRYSEVRRIDLIALATGARAVAKFEDLREPVAAALSARLRAKGLGVVYVGPYTKRFDVSVSDAAGPAARSGLYTVIASHGSEAPAIAEMERDRSIEGARRAGLLLGYPRCCVEAFVSVEASVVSAVEGINEAAIRSSAGLHDEIPWEMNTLSEFSPVGFTPCRADCPEALAFARRLLDALGHADPEGRSVVERALRRPVLFFRYPIFYVFEGSSAPGHSGGRPPITPGPAGATRAVRYSAALPNDDGAGLPRALCAWQEEEFGRALADGDLVVLSETALEVRRGGETRARWSLADARVPVLFRFR